MVGNFSPHEAFTIGGTNSVRGYEEGAVGSGRSYVVGSGEVSFPMVGFFSDVSKISFPNGVNIMTLILAFFLYVQRGPVEGVLFTDYGTDMGSGATVPGTD